MIPVPDRAFRHPDHRTSTAAVRAAAMAPFGDRAGMAAALLGTLQFTIAALITFLIGYLHDGTALPLAAVIFACGGASYVLLRTLTGPPAPEPA